MTNTNTLNKPAATHGTEKYTEEQTKSLLKLWGDFCEKTEGWKDEQRKATDTYIAELAKQFQKTTRSIIGKLTRHGVYTAKNKADKKGTSNQNKQELAQAIGDVLRMSEPEVNSLTVAGKTALSKIFNALANSVPNEPLTPQQVEAHNRAMEMLLGEISLDVSSIPDLQNVKPETIIDIADSIQAVIRDYEKEYNDCDMDENLKPQA